MQRREVVQLLAGAALGAGMFRPLHSAAAALGRGGAGAVHALDRIGIQLFTLRDVLAQEFEGTLARLAEIGYREVEFAGYHGRDPAAVRAALDATGLAAPSAHVSLDALAEDLPRTLEAAHTVGHQWLVVAWLPTDLRSTLDGFRRAAERFNRVAAAAKEAGIGFAYHNHDFEFAPIQGRIPFDLLAEETDAELVRLQLDLYWIARAGRDPLEYFDRFPGRFPMLHVKDMDAAGQMVDVGRGTIDFARVFARSGQAGVRHYFVEHDNPTDPMATARASHEHLVRLRTASD